MITKIKGWIPIQELREYYLIQCKRPSDVDYLIWGHYLPIQPTLTGWIKYWRESIRKHPQLVIIYKSQQKQ